MSALQHSSDYQSAILPQPLLSARPERFDPIMLYLVPAFALAFLVPVHLLSVNNYGPETRQPEPNVYRHSKLARAGFLATCEALIGLLDSLECESTHILYSVVLVMPTIATCALAVNYFHRQRSPVLLHTYLVMIGLADIVRVWNYQLSLKHWVVSMLSFLAAAVNTTLFLSESYISSPGSVAALAKNFVREKGADELSDTSLWDRLVVLVSFGFCEWLETEDLPILGDEFSSSNLLKDFDETWIRVDKHSPYALAKTVLHTLNWPLIDAVPPRLFHFGLQFYLTFLIRRVLVFVSNKGSRQDDTEANVVVTMALTMGAMMITCVWRIYMSGRVDIFLHGILSSQILKKSVTLPLADAAKGEAAVHLHTSVEDVMMHMHSFHRFWIAPLEVAIGLYAFHRLEGAPAYFMLLPLFLGICAAVFIGQSRIDAMSTWIVKTDRRLDQTSRLLPYLKNIRILGLQQSIVELLQSFRLSELEASKLHHFYSIWTWISTSMMDNFSQLAVIGGAVYWTKTLDQANAVAMFTTMNLVQVIIEPAFAIVQQWPRLKNSSWAMYRIQEFLLSDEWTEQRTFTNQASTILNGAGAMVIFRNAAIAGETQDKALIHGVTSTTKRGSLVVISGPIGSGKSLLLKAIAGVAKLVHGSLEIVGTAQSVAYCGQTSWFPGKTISECIVGDCAFERTWYAKVISACSLKEDIRQLPGGSQFEIGPDGRNLSSGQRQRLALARAIYTQSSILVFDDVFSMLDHDTLSTIITALFEPGGLLKRMGATVFLSTQAAQFFDLADQVFYLDRDHNLEIASSDTEIRSLTRSKIGTVLPTNESTNNDSDSENDADELYFVRELERDYRQLQQQDIPFEEHDFNNRDYFALFKSIPIWALGIWIVSNLIVTSYERLTVAFIFYWVDETKGAVNPFWPYILAVLLNVPIMGFEGWLYLIYVVPKSAIDLHHQFIGGLMRSPLAVITLMNDGALLTQLTEDITRIGRDIPLASNFKRVAYSIFMFLTDLAIIAYGTPPLLYLTPAFTVCATGIEFLYLRSSRQLYHLSEEVKSTASAALTEITGGLEHIRGMGLQNDYVSKCLKTLDEVQRSSSAAKQLESWAILFVHAIMCTLMLLVTLIAVYSKPGTVTPRGIGLSFYFVQWTWLVLYNMLNSSAILDTLVVSLSRLLRFIESTTDEDEDVVAMPEHWPHDAAVTFTEVDAIYRTPAREHVALRQVTLAIEAGKKVAIVGRTGSGKSTLLLTLFNELEYNGSITIDNVEVSTISKANIYSAITAIPQEFTPLPGTVRDNVFPWDMAKAADERAATDPQIIRVLKQVGLWAHVEARGGLDSIVEELELSNGQKQLLSIAQGILHHRIRQTKLILMDEVTSGMDEETEARIQALMMHVFAKCTVLMVTHRTRVIAYADMTAEFVAGRLLLVL